MANPTGRTVNTSIGLGVKSGYNVPSKGRGCDVFVVCELVSKAKSVSLLIQKAKCALELVAVGRGVVWTETFLYMQGNTDVGFNCVQPAQGKPACS